MSEFAQSRAVEGVQQRATLWHAPIVRAIRTRRRGPARASGRKGDPVAWLRRDISHEDPEGPGVRREISIQFILLSISLTESLRAEEHGKHGHS